MTSPRLPGRDPRTVARDIPGIFDALFPQLAPGVVIHFNSKAYAIDSCEAVPSDLISASSLQHAMLFEIAVAAGEQLVMGCESIDLDGALSIAIARQRRHFDAKLPKNITDIDKKVIFLVAENLATILSQVSADVAQQILVSSPHIPGYQWIASGAGDFAIGSRLIEVKCTNKPFSSSDYRQVMMYWLLSYASSVEDGIAAWSDALLVNPRLNKIVKVYFDEVIQVIGAGRSKIDILELFSFIVGDHNARMIAQV